MPESLLEILPTVYQHLLPPGLQGPAPDETRATCSSCAMCAPSGAQPAPEQLFFKPDLKCCTYHPTLPNYLVGGVLRDTKTASAEGQRRIRAQIAGRVGVTPRWVAAPLKTMMLHRVSRSSCFGRSPTFRCPYYEIEGGGCTIWAYRESTCSTFFCKYDAAADGQVYWRAVLGYLSRVEIVLSAHVVQTLGSPDMVDVPLGRKQLTREELEDRAPSSAAYQSWWRAWEGREEAFYRAAAGLVDTLTADDLAGLWADEEAQRRLEVTVADDKLQQLLVPQYLQLDPSLHVVDQPEEMALVESYSDYDPAILPKDLLEILDAFSPEETVSEVLSRLDRDEGITLAEELVADLFRRRILVGC